MAKTYTEKQRKALVEKIEETYNSSDQITIKEACAACGISDATYYNWRHRYNNDASNNTETAKSGSKPSPDKNKSDVEHKVVNLKKEKPFLGYTKISKQMAYSYGIKISSRKVKAILKKYNLDKTDYPRPKKQHAPRRFERDSRNEMWLMDIMYYSIEKEGRFYLISALDDYSRFITSYGIFKKQTMANVIDVLHQGFEEYGYPRELLTDRGSQFHSWKGKTQFEKLLDKLDIKHILASSQHPKTIGKLESFHRNIQRELFRQKHFETMEEVKAAVANYIEYYNHDRVHMGIDYLTPADRYFGLKQDAKKLLEQAQANDNNDTSDNIYLVGRIDGQPVRAKENNKGKLEVFIAGKKTASINSSKKIKEFFQLA